MVAMLVAAMAALSMAAPAAAEYAFVEKWGDIGSGGDPNTPAGMPAVDSTARRAYLSDRDGNALKIYGLDGSWIKTIGAEGDHDGEFQAPNAVALDAENDAVFVADVGNHRIQVLDREGNFRAKWPAAPSDPPPSGLSGLDTGEALAGSMPGRMIYVCDFTRWTLTKLSVTYGSPPSISPVDSWTVGSGCGGVAVDVARDRVYVTPAHYTLPAGIGVAVYKLDGTPVETWGTPGIGDGQFQMATGIDADARGNVYVADTLIDRVQVFGSDGGLRGKFGGSGVGDGQLSGTWGVAVAADETTYVTDVGTQVKVFRDIVDASVKPSFKERAAVRIEAGLAVRRPARKKKRPYHRAKRRAARASTGGLAARATVGYGQAATLRGRAYDAQGNPLIGALLALEAKVAVAGATWSRVGSATTDGSGNYEVKVPPGPSRDVRVSFPGDDTHAEATSPELSLSVKGRIKARIASARRLRPGQSIVVTGKLGIDGMTRIPPNFLIVRQRETRPQLGAPHWTAVPGTVRVDGKGGIKWTFKLRPQLRTRRLQIQVASRPDPATWPYLAARSKVMSFTVVRGPVG